MSRASVGGHLLTTATSTVTLVFEQTLRSATVVLVVLPLLWEVNSPAGLVSDSCFHVRKEFKQEI